MTLRQLRGGPRRRRSHRLDVLLTHAPPRGVGDGTDPVHQGFPALNVLAGRLQPPLLLHGHVDPDPDPAAAATTGSAARSSGT